MMLHDAKPLAIRGGSPASRHAYQETRKKHASPSEDRCAALDRDGKDRIASSRGVEQAMTNASRDGRNAAVTGAGSGLGRDIALGLAEKGYAVFGTAMTQAEVQDLSDASGARVRLALCDITNEQAVKTWAHDVSVAVGGDRGLDVLISNAGILTPGPLEVLPPSGASSTSTCSARCRS